MKRLPFIILKIARFNRRIDIFVFCVVYDNRAQREYSQHQAGGIDSAQQKVNAEIKPFSTVDGREAHAGEDDSQKRCDQSVPHIILGNGYLRFNLVSFRKCFTYFIKDMR